MQTIKSFYRYSAVLLGIAVFSFLAPSCSENDDPVVPTVVSATSITVTPSTVELTVGQSRSISVSVLPSNATDRTYNLESSDPTVASVANNRITAVAKGNATITATSNDGAFKAECTVTVTEATADRVVTLNSFTQGVLIYAGTNYGTVGLSHNWQIRLAGANYDIVDFTGNGEALMFEVNTDTSTTTEVTPGTYTILDRDKTEASTLLPFTAIPGMLDLSSQSPIGTWYLVSTTDGGDPEATNSIDSGEVVISNVGDTYTLRFSFMDDDQNIRFEGTYVGTLIFFDITQS